MEQFQGGRCTLDEPVMETIMRDLRSIGTKLKYVMLPKAREDRASGLREWDLWGPLVLCLALGIMLSMHAEQVVTGFLRRVASGQASLAFGLVFIIVWVGSGVTCDLSQRGKKGVVTVNALLLKGKISFFQSAGTPTGRQERLASEVCVLGRGSQTKKISRRVS